jgi:hypothetical protein
MSNIVEAREALKDAAQHLNNKAAAFRAFDWQDLAATVFLLALTIGALMIGG